MTRIVICRHGNTFDKGDVITRVGARTDLPLSMSGVDQARGLATHFAPQISGFTFTRAFCSSLRRTHQTADFILKGGHDIDDVKVLEFLKEIDYGVDENKPEEEVVRRLGQEAITRWDKEAVPPEGWDVNPDALIQAWRTFLSEQADTHEDILVVTSNGIARFALDAVDEITTDAPRKLRTAAYGIVEFQNGQSKITAWDWRPPK